MTNLSSVEYTGTSKTGIEDAIKNALSKITEHFDNYEIIETFCNQELQQEKNYHVTLKTTCQS